MTTELEKANQHIDLLTKLTQNLPQNIQPTEGKDKVTINNNYNSNVFAVIDKEHQINETATINILMNKGKQEDKKTNKEEEDLEANLFKKFNLDQVNGDKEVIIIMPKSFLENNG